MSKNQEFIDEFIKSDDAYEGMLKVVTKEHFNKIINNIKPTQVCYSSFLENYDIDNMLHPLQKIYEVEDYMSTYPSGSMNFGYVMAFKYKGIYYKFESYGGN